VEAPAEDILVDLHTRLRGTARRQLPLQTALLLRQLAEQFRADGQAVATGERFNLADIAEAGAHHYRFIAMSLVVVVDAADRLHAGIFATDVVAAFALLVPVVDTTNERRNQKHTRICASGRLGEGE